MLMQKLNTEGTFPWMSPKLSPPSWSMTCPTGNAFSRLWVVVLLSGAAKAGKGEHSRVAMWGECGPLLWAEGKADAAIRLEQLLNRLADNLRV